MRRAIPPFLQYVFMAWCLVKQKDNFTFYFNLRIYLINSRGLLTRGGPPACGWARSIKTTFTHAVCLRSIITSPICA
jgi:hypothetical protein